MTLLNAPEFDERKENRRRNIWVGSGIFVAVMVVLTVAGFLLGHGWLFTNLPAEHRVNVFLTAVQAGDYPEGVRDIQQRSELAAASAKVCRLSAAAVHRGLYDGERRGRGR